jgi:hypothetical protein
MAADPQQLKLAYKEWLAASSDYTDAWRLVIEGNAALDLQLMQAKIAEIDRRLAAFHRTAIAIVEARKAPPA